MELYNIKAKIQEIINIQQMTKAFQEKSEKFQGLHQAFGIPELKMIANYNQQKAIPLSLGEFPYFQVPDLRQFQGNIQVGALQIQSQDKYIDDFLPIGINLHNRPYVILGATGSGKTSLMSLMTLQIIDRSENNVIIFDPEGNVSKMLSVLKRPNLLVLEVEKNFRFNPFAIKDFPPNKIAEVFCNSITVSFWLGINMNTALYPIVLDLINQNYQGKAKTLYDLHSILKTFKDENRQKLCGRIGALINFNSIFNTTQPIDIELLGKSNLIIDISRTDHNSQTFIVNWIISAILYYRKYKGVHKHV